ncbi:uncharacterized protein LOC115321801 isoform X2 [Ixodes scapularis]|uniref:uncharacterized protein LOC115321801 isoform X2 n=1 Tax=Ixodes scapularis TaxID=6945 RepID=UPI001A9E889D|nr:uncharacterized protein LOC115321801 isoform X2 [Ixodes scapularis]
MPYVQFGRNTSRAHNYGHSSTSRPHHTYRFEVKPVKPLNRPAKTIHLFKGVADSQFHLDVSFGRVDGFKGLVFLTQLACLAACNLWEPEELHHKSERDAHLALLRGWCLEEGRTAPKVNAMAGNVLRLGPCGTGGSQVIKEDRTSAHSETM